MSYCNTCTCICVILSLFRNVWRIYLDQEKFEKAQKYAEVSSLKLSITKIHVHIIIIHVIIIIIITNYIYCY